MCLCGISLSIHCLHPRRSSFENPAWQHHLKRDPQNVLGQVQEKGGGGGHRAENFLLQKRLCSNVSFPRRRRVSQPTSKQEREPGGCSSNLESHVHGMRFRSSLSIRGSETFGLDILKERSELRDAVRALKRKGLLLLTHSCEAPIVLFKYAWQCNSSPTNTMQKVFA